ncbi:MAG: phosphoenolpyruvate--protein phosphotransferase [Acidobacteriota bacterium]
MRVLEGIGVSFGIAEGRALVIRRGERDVPRYRIGPGEVRREIRRFLGARMRAREEIGALRERARRTAGERYAGIFDAHLAILDDRGLGRRTIALIRERRINAEWALTRAVSELLATFGGLDDPFFRERGGDIEDVHERLQRVLAGDAPTEAHDLALEEDTIVVAPALSPSDALWLHQPRIAGFVTEGGSRTSHTAILANALEIPAVLGVERATELIAGGEHLIVDGHEGRVVVAPPDATRKAYADERRRLEELAPREGGWAVPVRTRDGRRIRVAANVEFPEELETCRRVGADGVGLYRSEFLFLTTAPRLPSEEDHFAVYRRILTSAAGQPVVIRTLDLGGEKYFHEVLHGGEANPVMGLRAVRLCLRRPEIFRTQLRALYRAAVGHPNLRVLVPMISSLEEWRRVRAFVGQVVDELPSGERPDPLPPLGCMIEVPAAALEAPRLAREADFLSLGTNDLVQYTLAVDRANAAVAHLHDPFHPAVLELIERTVVAGREASVPVSLCGEMASDPLGAITLVGLGLTDLSCNPLVIPEIRAVLADVDAGEAARTVARARRAGTGPEIRQEIEQAFLPRVRALVGEVRLEPGDGADPPG